jgi:hypothetical protein
MSTTTHAPTQFEPDPYGFWLSNWGPDLIVNKAPKRTGPTAIVVYLRVAMAAGERGAEISPDHDGAAFVTTLGEIAVKMSVPLVRRRLKFLAEIGLIDPVELPDVPWEPFTIRMLMPPEPQGAVTTPPAIEGTQL